MSECDEAAETLRRRRWAHEFAGSAAALQEDRSAAGAEGMFHQAATNGLLAIASSYLPKYGSAIRDTRLPPAAEILGDLIVKFGESDGICELPVEPIERSPLLKHYLDSGNGSNVPLQTEQLREAITRTDGPRHGRAEGGAVTAEDVLALVAMDDHPALQVLASERSDRYWRRGAADDSAEQARAAKYLTILEEWVDGELDRRCVNPPQRFVKPGDDDAVPVQTCPVCDSEALVPTAGDWMGYGITEGICVVCSYRRSRQASEDLNIETEWTARWADL